MSGFEHKRNNVTCKLKKSQITIRNVNNVDPDHNREADLGGERERERERDRERERQREREREREREMVLHSIKVVLIAITGHNNTSRPITY